jgi:dTDP-4-amino-4,6-dideoxygalactose transaminase
MSPLSRRVLDTQDFASIVHTRRSNYLQLESLLRDIAPPIFDSLPDGMCPLFYPFSTPHKLELWRRLREQGVQAVLFWLGGELGPKPGEFPEVDELRRTVLELPCHQDMTEEKITRLAQIVRKLQEAHAR